MSTDDVTKGIEQLRDTGKLTYHVAKAAISNPIEGEKLLRMSRIEEAQNEIQRTIDDMLRALFGDEKQKTKGLVADVLFLKINYWRGVWTVAGAFAVGGFLIASAITLLGIYIEWTRK